MGFCDENDDGEVDCREAMRASAKVVLLIINTIWLLMGLGLLIMGAYAIAQFEQYEGLIDTAVLYVVCAVGAVMILVTAIGYVGVLKLKKILLIIYAMCLFILCLGMIVVGISLLSYLSTVDASQTKKLGQAAAQSQKQAVARIQNFVNCSYNECCSKHGIKNFTDVKCNPSKVPGGKINGGVCSGFTDLKLNNIDQCKTYKTYDDGVLKWLQTNLTPLVSAILGVASVQLFAFCITMAFVCTEIRSGGGGIRGEKHEI
eukprot:g2720.t1